MTQINTLPKDVSVTRYTLCLKSMCTAGIAHSVAGNRMSLPMLLISYICENLQQTPSCVQNV